MRTPCFSQPFRCAPRRIALPLVSRKWARHHRCRPQSVEATEGDAITCVADVLEVVEAQTIRRPRLPRDSLKDRAAARRRAVASCETAAPGEAGNVNYHEALERAPANFAGPHGGSLCS